MATETIEMLIDGGKAVAGPTVGQKLGPLKINIQQVLQDINKKTESFKGMQVPVKLAVDTKTKEYKIDIGTPSTTELIKKELNLQKGSGTPDKQKIANISIEQCIKIAKMKMDSMFTDNLKSALKSVVGSCNSLGILIEGKTSSEIREEIDSGNYDNEIKMEKTEISEEKKNLLQVQLKEAQERITKELEKLKRIEEEIAPTVEKKEEAAEAPKPEAASKESKTAEKTEKEVKKAEPEKTKKK